jgi:nucleoside-diphosphate-sugar epimerase
VLAADRETIHDEAFNVGRDEDVVQIRTIATAVSERTGAPVTFAEGASPDKRDYRVDFGKITRLLPSFQPVWTVPAGIDQLAADMSRFGLTAQEFEHTFVRLEQINRLSAAGLLDEQLRRVGDAPTA